MVTVVRNLAARRGLRGRRRGGENPAVRFILISDAYSCHPKAPR